METIDWGGLVVAVAGVLGVFGAVGRYFLGKAKEADQHLRTDFDALRCELTETRNRVKELTAENARLRQELDTTIERLRQQEQLNARLEGQNEVLNQLMAVFGVKELTAIREAQKQKAA